VNLRQSARTAGAALLVGAAALLAPAGAASAQAPATPPASIQFYNGSSTPSQVGVEPWVAVYLDGKPVPFSALRPGMILNIAVDSQGKAIEIFASDQTVSGIVSEVHTSSGGQLYLVMNGRRYEARIGSTVVASGGQVLGSLLEYQSLVVGGQVTAFLGPDGRVGYVEIG
jgi:hypothetical protein